MINLERLETCMARLRELAGDPDVGRSEDAINGWFNEFHRALCDVELELRRQKLGRPEWVIEIGKTYRKRDGRSIPRTVVSYDPNDPWFRAGGKVVMSHTTASGGTALDSMCGDYFRENMIEETEKK